MDSKAIESYLPSFIRGWSVWAIFSRNNPLLIMFLQLMCLKWWQKWSVEITHVLGFTHSYPVNDELKFLPVFGWNVKKKIISKRQWLSLQQKKRKGTSQWHHSFIFTPTPAYFNYIDSQEVTLWSNVCPWIGSIKTCIGFAVVELQWTVQSTFANIWIEKNWNIDNITNPAKVVLGKARVVLTLVLRSCFSNHCETFLADLPDL